MNPSILPLRRFLNSNNINGTPVTVLLFQEGDFEPVRFNATELKEHIGNDNFDDLVDYVLVYKADTDQSESEHLNTTSYDDFSFTFKIVNTTYKIKIASPSNYRILPNTYNIYNHKITLTNNNGEHHLKLGDMLKTIFKNIETSFLYHNNGELYTSEKLDDADYTSLHSLSMIKKVYEYGFCITAYMMFYILSSIITSEAKINLYKNIEIIDKFVDLFHTGNRCLVCIRNQTNQIIPLLLSSFEQLLETIKHKSEVQDETLSYYTHTSQQILSIHMNVFADKYEKAMKRYHMQGMEPEKEDDIEMPVQHIADRRWGLYSRIPSAVSNKQLRQRKGINDPSIISPVSKIAGYPVTWGYHGIPSAVGRITPNDPNIKMKPPKASAVGNKQPRPREGINDRILSQLRPSKGINDRIPSVEDPSIASARTLYREPRKPRKHGKPEKR